jgi:cobalt-zinc-cadmium efflux system membrane fusion protein
MKATTIFSALLLSLLLGSCGKDSSPATAASATPAGNGPEGGSTVHPTTTTWCHEVNATGRIEAPPQSSAVLHAPMSGIIKDIRHLPGDLVKQGERLAYLEHPDIVTLQEDYLTAGSRLHYLEQSDARNSILAAAEAVPLRQQQEVAAERKGLETRRKALAQRLRLLGIDPAQLDKGSAIVSAVALSAPITGYLTQVNITQGQYVDPATQLFALVDDSHLHLALKVMAQDAALIREEQAVRYSIAGDSADFKGTVHRVNHAVDRATGTVEVHVHMDSARILPAGTFVNGRICTGQDTVTVIPVAALQGELEDRWVWIKEGNAWKQQPVQVGAAQAGFIQVLRGIDTQSSVWTR